MKMDKKLEKELRAILVLVSEVIDGDFDYPPQLANAHSRLLALVPPKKHVFKADAGDTFIVVREWVEPEHKQKRPRDRLNVGDTIVLLEDVHIEFTSGGTYDEEDENIEVSYRTPISQEKRKKNYPPSALLTALNLI